MSSFTPHFHPRSLLILSLPLLILLSACTVTTKAPTSSAVPVEYTVVSPDTLPAEFLDSIESRQTEPFRITYADNEFLYLARGYGEQPTSGYSIEADACRETEDSIYLHTTLIGPKSGEEITETPTYPYVVVRLGVSGKHIVFE